MSYVDHYLNYAAKFCNKPVRLQCTRHCMYLVNKRTFNFAKKLNL